MNITHKFGIGYIVYKKDESVELLIKDYTASSDGVVFYDLSDGSRENENNLLSHSEWVAYSKAVANELRDESTHIISQL